MHSTDPVEQNKGCIKILGQRDVKKPPAKMADFRQNLKKMQ